MSESSDHRKRTLASGTYDWSVLDSDMPPVFVPLDMLVLQAQEQGLQA